jgi:hypothetical protein
MYSVGGMRTLGSVLERRTGREFVIVHLERNQSIDGPTIIIDLISDNKCRIHYAIAKLSCS